MFSINLHYVLNVVPSIEKYKVLIEVILMLNLQNSVPATGSHIQYDEGTGREIWRNNNGRD